jgi:hypothetical protein
MAEPGKLNIWYAFRVSGLSAPGHGHQRTIPESMKSFARLAMILAALFAPSVAAAQVGSTTDIIMGKVTSPEGTPLVGAKVSVTSSETQITRT